MTQQKCYLSYGDSRIFFIAAVREVVSWNHGILVEDHLKSLEYHINTRSNCEGIDQSRINICPYEFSWLETHFVEST